MRTRIWIGLAVFILAFGGLAWWLLSPVDDPNQTPQPTTRTEPAKKNIPMH